MYAQIKKKNSKQNIIEEIPKSEENKFQKYKRAHNYEIVEIKPQTQDESGNTSPQEDESSIVDENDNKNIDIDMYSEITFDVNQNETKEVETDVTQTEDIDENIYEDVDDLKISIPKAEPSHKKSPSNSSSEHSMFAEDNDDPYDHIHMQDSHANTKTECNETDDSDVAYNSLNFGMTSKLPMPTTPTVPSDENVYDSADNVLPHINVANGDGYSFATQSPAIPQIESAYDMGADVPPKLPKPLSEQVVVAEPPKVKQSKGKKKFLFALGSKPNKSPTKPKETKPEVNKKLEETVSDPETQTKKSPLLRGRRFSLEHSFDFNFKLKSPRQKRQLETLNSELENNALYIKQKTAASK